jgi:hypothetical protein
MCFFFGGAVILDKSRLAFGWSVKKMFKNVPTATFNRVILTTALCKVIQDLFLYYRAYTTAIPKQKYHINMSDSQGLQIRHYLNVCDGYGVIVVMTAAVAMTTMGVVVMVVVVMMMMMMIMIMIMKMVVVVVMMMMMMMIIIIGASTCFITKLTINVPGDPLQFQYTS